LANSLGAQVFSLTSKQVSSTPFPALFRTQLPTMHREIFGTYNAVCRLIKLLKYDRARLGSAEDVLKPTRNCDVCTAATAKTCTGCKLTFYCSPGCQKLAWRKHKLTCKPQTSPTTEAELRILHKGITLLNRCIQRTGVEYGPTSVVLDFLEASQRYWHH